MAGPAIECAAACSVTVELAPAPPNPENIVDIGLVFTLFLGAAVTVWCLRSLLNIFTAPDER